jgi:hypothetical protein
MSSSTHDQSRITIPQPGKTRWSSLNRAITAFIQLEPLLETAVKSYIQSPPEKDVPGMEEFSLGWLPSTVQFLKDFNKILDSIAVSLKFLEGSRTHLCPHSHHAFHIPLSHSFFCRPSLPYTLQSPGDCCTVAKEMCPTDASKR